MWFGIAAIVLFLAVIPLAGWLDRGHGVARENRMALLVLVLVGCGASVVACIATRSP